MVQGQGGDDFIPTVRGSCWIDPERSRSTHRGRAFYEIETMAQRKPSNLRRTRSSCLSMMVVSREENVARYLSLALLKAVTFANTDIGRGGGGQLGHVAHMPSEKKRQKA